MDADPDQRVSVMWQACLSLIQAACKLLFWKEKAQCPVMCLLYLPSSFVKMNRKIHFRWLILSRIHVYMEEETSADTQVCLWLGSAFHAIYVLGIFPFGLKLQSLLKLKLSGLGAFTSLRWSTSSCHLQVLLLCGLTGCLFFLFLFLSSPSLFPWTFLVLPQENRGSCWCWTK